MNSKYERWFKFWVPIFTLKKDNWFLQKIKSEVCSLPLNRNINALFTHKMAFFFFQTKVIVNYIKLNILCRSRILERQINRTMLQSSTFLSVFQWIAECVFNNSCCTYTPSNIYFKRCAQVFSYADSFRLCVRFCINSWFYLFLNLITSLNDCFANDSSSSMYKRLALVWIATRKSKSSFDAYHSPMFWYLKRISFIP